MAGDYGRARRRSRVRLYQRHDAIFRVADDDSIPDELIEEPDYVDFDYTIFDVVDDATYMLAKTIADRSYVAKHSAANSSCSTPGRRFKSYVAIVLLLDKYNVN